MVDESTRTPLAAATAGIRQMVLASQRRDNGEAVGACRNCEHPDSWCQCRQLAQAALDGLFRAWYDIQESR